MLKSSDDSDFDNDEDYDEEDNHRADNDLLFRGANIIIPRRTYKCYSCEPPDCRHVVECTGAVQVSTVVVIWEDFIQIHTTSLFNKHLLVFFLV